MRLSPPRPRITLRRRGVWRAASLVLPVVLVNACADPTKFAPPCPQPAILSDAADVVRYRPTGHDVTDMVLDGSITGIGGTCSAGENGTTKVTIKISLDLSRGPAATGRHAEVIYFIAVARDQSILDKAEYPISVEFPANTDIMHLTSGEIVLNLPTTPKLSGAAFSVFTGFQLTPAELAINRARHQQGSTSP